MPHTTSKPMAGANASPPEEFWENELEMSTHFALRDLESVGARKEWIKKRTGRQVEILRRALCMEDLGSVRKNKAYLEGSDDEELRPYVLVSHFAKNKSKVATFSFAKGVLSDELLDICRVDEEEFDKIALLFAIYLRKYSDLKLVFHLDKIHKSGFARMKLKKSVRKPSTPLGDFLKHRTIADILARYDKTKRDGHTSELRDVVPYDDRHLVFIRRAERPDHIISESGGIEHGFRVEWITLNFQDGAKRVNISSVSVGVPLEIANRLASAYFGRECEYENDKDITYAKQLEVFLEDLRKGPTDDLKLVELVISN